MQRIINQIPPHDVFVSGFLGGCAVMRRLRPAGRRVGIDLDREIVEMWYAGQVVWDRPTQTPIELHCCDAIEWLRYQFGFYLVGSPEVAASAEASGPDLPGEARYRVAGNGDSSRSRQAERWFLYLDPPYLIGSRKSAKRLYRHEMSEADHVRLLETISWIGSRSWLDVRILIHHYDCDLYRSWLESWRSFRYRSQCRTGWAWERVWLNYDEPCELHDCSFLGSNKRERERINRRLRRWKSRLEQLPALERQAILEGLK